MLFGNTPPQRPRGLFGAFAPNMQGMPLEPIQQAMTRPVAPEQADQMQAMMGASMDKKPGFFAEGGIGRMIAGGLGDVLLQRTGGQPIYQQHMMQQQALKQRQQMMQQQREADWQDFQRQFDYTQAHQKPVNNDTVNDFNWYKGLSAEDRALYDQFHPVTMMGPQGPIAVPRPTLGGMGGGPKPGTIEEGYRFKGGNPADPNAWEPVGGGVGNGTGGFPVVTGGKLDQITMGSESGGKRYNASGGYLTSSKGAMGEMQVLPSTARDPGFGIKPWNGTPDDLARVGREYRAKMQARYKGNLPLMWAAYNAGPGRVDQALARGGNNWLDHVPAETRVYVERNMRAVRGN